MDRREFLAAFGGVAAAPGVAVAQKPPALPVVGFLSSGSQVEFTNLTAAFRDGLKAQGFEHGKNVWIDYNWAGGRYEELSAMAVELARRKVALIAATGGHVSARAALKATTTIPIVFVVGFDPVQLGLVASLNNPGGNATGVSVFTTELTGKRLDLLGKLLPQMRTVGILVNPGAVVTKIEVDEARLAAKTLGLTVVVLNATTESELDAAFAAASEKQIGALIVQADPFFNVRRRQVVAMAAKKAIPVMYPFRSFVEAGGLISYGTELTWAYNQIGQYAGRIIKGTEPAELPVLLPTEFRLIINQRTVKELGLEVPETVLSLADDIDVVLTKEQR